MRRVLAVILSGGLAFGLGCKKHAPQATPQTKQQNVSSWDPQGVRLAAFLFADDFENYLEGNDSILSKADLQEISQVGVISTSHEYQQDYDANEIAADNKYRGKKILLTGVIDSINKNAFDQGYLTLRSGSLVGVEAQLNPNALQQAASLSRGTRVMIVCDPGTRIATVPTAAECRFLSEYLHSIGASPEQQVHEFFAGRRPFTLDEVSLIAFEILAWHIRACHSGMQSTAFSRKLLVEGMEIAHA